MLIHLPIAPGSQLVMRRSVSRAHLTLTNGRKLSVTTDQENVGSGDWPAIMFFVFFQNKSRLRVIVTFVSRSFTEGNQRTGSLDFSVSWSCCWGEWRPQLSLAVWASSLSKLPESYDFFFFHVPANQKISLSSLAWRGYYFALIFQVLKLNPDCPAALVIRGVAHFLQDNTKYENTEQ